MLAGSGRERAGRPRPASATRHSVRARHTPVPQRHDAGAALTALLLIGPGVIFGFTAAMTLGLFVGSYSSIYMANPILVWLGVGPHSFVPQQTDAEKAEAKLKEGIGGAQP